MSGCTELYLERSFRFRFLNKCCQKRVVLLKLFLIVAVIFSRCIMQGPVRNQTNTFKQIQNELLKYRFSHLCVMLSLTVSYRCNSRNVCWSPKMLFSIYWPTAAIKLPKQGNFELGLAITGPASSMKITQRKILLGSNKALGKILLACEGTRVWQGSHQIMLIHLRP